MMPTRIAAHVFLSAASVYLAGCASAPTSGIETPIVDMAGVDQVKYNQDLAACFEGRPFISVSGYMSDCMRGKGYRVLASYTG
jgi:hypothetical protein